MVLEPEGDGWRASNGGNCWQLAPVLPLDSSWAEVSADAVATDATEVAVTVMERRCTGARDPLPHLDEPAFVVDEEAITVYWTSNPPDAAECPSNPSVPTTLTLPEPLGDRRAPRRIAVAAGPDRLTYAVRRGRGRRTPPR